MNWREFLLTVPLVWIVALWLIILILIAVVKVYFTAEQTRKVPFLPKITSLLALALPLIVAARVSLNAFQEGSFLLLSGGLFGIGFGGIALGAMIVRVIVFVLGGERNPRQAADSSEASEDVLLNGKPLDDL